MLPVEVKAEFVARLVDAGHTVVETTSFVHPRWVPQLADAEALLAAVTPAPGVRYPVLVPNERGLDRALALGVATSRCSARPPSRSPSATSTAPSRSRWRCSPRWSPRAREAGVAVRAYLSMCFGDPWEGEVPIPQVVEVASRHDGVGLLGALPRRHHRRGHPRPGGGAARCARRRRRPGRAIAVHFHDTYGQALANTLAALQRGVTTVDASAGGLGGCPYAQSATGNLATEDLVWQLHGLGVATGIDLPKLVDTSVWMAEQLGRPSPSRTVTALAGG